MVQRFLNFIQPIAEQLGAPGLALVAFLDSSFISLPEVGDALIVLLVIKNPSEWLVYAAATTVGSMAGCYTLYAIARKGGEAFVRRRFQARHIERGLAVFRRHGLFALVVPSILPPPMPFKIFVLLSGIAGVRPRTFILAIGLGRGARYFGEAWLAYEYGDRATDFIRDNLPAVSIWAAVGVAVVGLGVFWWRRRMGRVGVDLASK